MKKTKRNWQYYVLAFCIFLSMLCTACSGASGNKSTNATVKADFGSAEDFEAALNAGQDLTGKTVTFKVKSVHPDSILGHNLWAGEHLNFISDEDPGIKSGDIVTVKVTKISNSLGSWIIHYELQSSTSQSASVNPTKTTTPTTSAEPKTEGQVIGGPSLCGNYYAVITAIKSLDYIQSEDGKENVSEDEEVIYVFADVANFTKRKQTITNDLISLYADSNKATETVLNTPVCLDGYNENWMCELDPSMDTVLLRGFIVEKGWKEIIIFIDEKYWIVHPDDVGDKEEYKDKTWFPFEMPKLTAEGEEIYSEDYSIVFDGFTIYTKHGEKYAIFKFTVNNTTGKTIDYDHVGFDMRGYYNRRPLGDATYLLDDTIDHYTNVFDIDDIKSGMSAKVYVAFSTEVEVGCFSCAYDVGFGGMSKLLAMVHVESK